MQQAARFGAADHDLFFGSVMVVAGARNYRELAMRTAY
jgi:hypothetical protein